MPKISTSFLVGILMIYDTDPRSSGRCRDNVSPDLSARRGIRKISISPVVHEISDRSDGRFVFDDGGSSETQIDRTRGNDEDRPEAAADRLIGEIP